MDALILVDIQNDFLPDGALPVPAGDEVISVANRLLSAFEFCVATQDWHPADHGSFAANHSGRQPGDVIDLHGLRQVLWPTHCVQGTSGALLAGELETSRLVKIFRKGMDPTVDSYSGFFDNGHRQATGLGDFLCERQVTDVFVAGLATDYCVKFTTLDARELGFSTHLINDGCRGVDLRAGDIARSLDEMEKAGVRIIDSDELLR